jgi:hypothetical protein
MVSTSPTLSSFSESSSRSSVMELEPIREQNAFVSYTAFGKFEKIGTNCLKNRCCLLSGPVSEMFPTSSRSQPILRRDS